MVNDHCAHRKLNMLFLLLLMLLICTDEVSSFQSRNGYINKHVNQYMNTQIEKDYSIYSHKQNIDNDKFPHQSRRSRKFVSFLLSLFTFTSIPNVLINHDFPPAPFGFILNAVAAESTDLVENQRKSVTLPSGVEYFDYKVGDGAEATEGKSVQFNWVLRRSNGYYVDASADHNNEPFIYKVGNTKKVLKGIDEGIRGMKVNGIRRMNIPPNLAYEGVDEGMPGPLPDDFGRKRQILSRLGKETWYFEIQLIKVK